MKICKIKFKNIHSLKGEHTIDFKDGILDEAGLFLITGPTGSGKSTLLDVITLALYNRIPRINTPITANTIEKEGVILTQNTSDCFAEIEYQINTTIYRSSWSIRRKRTGTLDDRKHELSNVNSSEILSSSRKEVPSLNEKIIGLKYEQFIQSILLAQGQFSKLLLAKKDVRNKLLEELTGTSVYSTIGKKVFEKHKSAAIEVQRQTDRMEGIVLLTDKEIETTQEEISFKKPLFDKLKINKKSLTNQQLIKEQLIKNKQTQAILKQEWKALVIEKEAFKTNNDLLVKHNLFVPFKQQAQHIEQLNDTITTDITNIIKGEELLNLKKKDLLLLLKECQQVVQSEINPSNFEIKIENFRKKVQQLLDLEKEKETEFKAEKSKQSDVINQLYDFKITINTSQSIEQQIAFKTQEINKIHHKAAISNLNEVRQQKNILITNRTTATQLLNNKTLLKEKNNYLARLKETVTITNQRLKLLKKENDYLSEQKEVLLPQLQIAIAVYEKAQKQFNLHHHRQQLIENEPCPLCGSLEHPFVKNQPDTLVDTLKEKVELLQLQQKNIEHEKTVKQTEHEGLKKQQLQNNKELIDKQNEINQLHSNCDQLCDKLNWLPTQKSISKWENAAQEIENNFQLLNEIEQSFHVVQLLDKLTLIVKKIKQFHIDITHIKTEINSLYTGSNIQSDLNKIILKKNNITKDISNYTQRLNDLKYQIKNNKLKVTQLTDELTPKLKTLGINKIDELAIHILDEPKAHELRKAQHILSEKQVRIKTHLDALNKEIEANENNNNPKISLETVNTQLQEIEISSNTLEKELWKLDQKLEIDQKLRVSQQEKQIKLDQLIKHKNVWETMNKLIGDATGKKFSNFVQDLTLKQLIEYGNKRLIGFSDRYLLTVDTDVDQLKVIDTYMGNTQRAVSSLSGGETFKLSLALAFGLSDLAAKNVTIQSLFIDEGFGTLDPESLDQSITILETMQNTSNKTIGIISHVGELKERISTKVNLIKSGNGYSKIDIE